MALQSTRIQNALVAAVNNCTTFYPVTVNAGTKAYSANEAVSIAPKTVLAHQVSARFSEARRNKSKFLHERTSWTFRLIVKFPQEVSVEKFEDSLREPISLPRITGLDQQALLLLTEAEYDEPVQQSGSTGTWVAYTFEALLSPI